MTDVPTSQTNIAILILAAGSSSRMRGGDKLLEEVDGRPLLQKMAKQACAVSQTVLICLRPNDTSRRVALQGLECVVVEVTDASEGMAHSLRAGIAKLPGNCSAVMVIPADMPDLTQSDLKTIAQSHEVASDAIIRATSADNHPGHPVLFPARLFGELCCLTGDIGAKNVLKRNAPSVQLIKLPDEHALTDLDTPEEWRTWRDNRLR
ncbi:nucleotidyltransferase family protein [Shimia sagamensis]|uniref:CTP:molybdopterin cytidylyltransferase MocA n=1 Tax=Shimia sagamensis TaxID=1566352 RepID=A0ABY1PE03_9RHOB|nr:nucleotidyltransferase family protein [Shimia sagamensis]SMP32291.1 CTP:molybdopterin cytidylyltransferase MocA [Shimia sagamensis]